jgi:hypothetical protein
MVLCWLLAASLVASCATSDVNRPSATEEPTRRAVGIETQGCGHAPGSDGSGVLLRPDLVLTAAHVVAGSATVSASRPRTSTDESKPEAISADVVALDRDRDLALIRTHSPLVTGTLEVPIINTVDGGAVVHFAGHNPVLRRATVVERTVIVADRVRGSQRVRRLGYLVSATTERGDSGSGLFHHNRATGDQELVGLVFAVSTDDSSRTWAVAGSEIEAFLTATSPADGDRLVCDREESVLVPMSS